MGKISARFPKPRTAERISLDAWLARLANVSQALLLALGVFGYFYTVLPLYQKALLDEDIAQKTLELRAKERELADLAAQVKSRSDELRLRDDQLRATARKAEAAEKALSASELAATKAASAASAADAARREAETKYRSAAAEAEARYLELRREIVTTASGSLGNCLVTIVPIGEQLLDGSEFRRCVSPYFESPSQSLRQLRPADTARYIETGRRLVDELEPQFREYVARVNARVKEVARDRSQRQLGSAKDYDKILAFVGEDYKQRVDGYRTILDQLIRELRRATLQD